MHRTNGHKSAKRADPTRGMDDGDEIARLMRPFYEMLAELASQDAYDDHGIDVTFDLANPYAQTALDKLAKNVRGVAETTRQEIAGLVGLAAEDGWSNEVLAAAILDAGVTKSESRA